MIGSETCAWRGWIETKAERRKNDLVIYYYYYTVKWRQQIMMMMSSYKHYEPLMMMMSLLIGSYFMNWSISGWNTHWNLYICRPWKKKIYIYILKRQSIEISISNVNIRFASYNYYNLNATHSYIVYILLSSLVRSLLLGLLPTRFVFGTTYNWWPGRWSKRLENANYSTDTVSQSVHRYYFVPNWNCFLIVRL